MPGGQGDGAWGLFARVSSAFRMLLKVAFELSVLGTGMPSLCGLFENVYRILVAFSMHGEPKGTAALLVIGLRIDKAPKFLAQRGKGIGKLF